MKPLSEEQSMLIFDLLEGNLSEKEKAFAFALIDSDVNFKKEYELLKNTYLPKDDAVHFPDKIALFKIPKSNNRFYLFIKPITAAAIFIMVFGAGYYFYRSQDHSTIKNKYSGISNPIKLPAEKEEKTMLNVISNQEKTLILSKIKPTSTHYPAVDTSLVAVPEKPGNMILSLNSTTPGMLAIAKDGTDEIEYRISIYPQQTIPTTNRRKRSLYYQLFKTGKTMMANLQLPQLKIKTLKSKNRLPNINIQINTPANYATYNEN